MVTLIFLAKKLARAGKPCLATLLPGGVAWSVALTSAIDLHKAQGWASLAQLQRGSQPGNKVSKVSLEFDFSRGFPTWFAEGVQVVRGLAPRNR